MKSVLVVTALLLVFLGCESRADAARFLYILSCDAHVDKLDTVTGEKVDTFDLTKSAGQQVIPSADGGFDGCLVNQAIYEDASALFFTIAPVQARLDSRAKRDYRMLAFSVPSMNLAREIRAGKSLDQPPRIALGDDKKVYIRKSRPNDARTDLDLRAFSPDKSARPNQIIETSGRFVLLRLFARQKEDVSLAIADKKAKTMARIEAPISTTVHDVHLSPGGAAILVIESEAAGPASKNSGAMSLFSSSTGAILKNFIEPRIKGLNFVCISPSGQAIFRSKEKYEVVNLGLSFDASPVVSHVSDLPEYFHADR